MKKTAFIKLSTGIIIPLIILLYYSAGFFSNPAGHIPAHRHNSEKTEEGSLEIPVYNSEHQRDDRLQQPESESLTSDSFSNGPQYSLFACGDTMIARWMHYHVYEKGATWPLRELKSLIKGADIAMTNLECVVSTRGHFFDKGERRPYLYRARPEMLDVLTEAGFDLVVTANNHAMDYGPQAIVEQMELLEAAGISQVGSGRNIKEAAAPTYIRVGDIIIAFIGLETTFPAIAATSSRPGVCHAKGEKAILEYLRDVVADARQCSDLVVFTPHWGGNWTENPSVDRINLAHKIIDLGVDAILGHSSHQIHGIEVYKGKPIIYDMGSFLFDNVGQGRMRFSAGFLLTFDHSGFRKINIYPLLLSLGQTAYAEGENIKQIHDLVQKLSREVDTDLKFEKADELLTVSLNPDPLITSKTKRQVLYFETNRTVPVPSDLRARKTNVVFQQAPEWTKGFDPAKLEYGLTVLGWRAPASVRPRGAFAMEVALSVPGPIKGKWVANIKGICRDDANSSFIWRHPVADGGWLTYLWQKGQIVVDRTLVRIPDVSEGVYDLYWSLINYNDMKITGLPEADDLSDEGYVKLGTITISNENAPEGLANVALYDD